MSTSQPLKIVAILLFAGYVLAWSDACARDTLVYVSLPRPCRLLDTRGSGPLSSAQNAYLFGISDADITSKAQNGDGGGCGMTPAAGIAAISVDVNMFNATASGNIFAWAADETQPQAGTAVYNPAISSPTSSGVLYNGGSSTIALGASGSANSGRFYVAVANGQIDMTINVTGYWVPVSWNSTIYGLRSVALGSDNEAAGSYSTAMGSQTLASGFGSTAMGFSNESIGDYSTTMGRLNLASGSISTAIGENNLARGTGSTAIGEFNTVVGDFSTAIGAFNVASGTASIAMGSNATNSTFGEVPVVHNHSFAFGDGSDLTANDTDSQFMIRASGGLVFYTSTGVTTGTQLAAGSGSWTALSDRNSKDAVKPIDARDVLARVVDMPVSTWHYKTQDSQYRHMGPMAQDFRAAFGLGESDRGIDTIDADGVAFAAIQGLHAEVEELRAQLAEKDRQIADLRSGLTVGLAEMKAQLAAIRESGTTKVAMHR